ncbi:MAG: hypothetical protein ACYDAY_11465 [Candidatus Dormibacteria bacterium]
MGVRRHTLLTTHDLNALDDACILISRAFDGGPPYLVGSAESGEKGTYRDVDVRLILDDEEFAAVCPTQRRWELLSLGIGAFLRERTGLPIDFQIQRLTEANAKYGERSRNPLGMSRVFAGGGDATPDWV